jgi:nucleoside-diphosphate-sugar epimerase
MKIAITGATGFVGKHLIKELITEKLIPVELVIIGRSQIDLQRSNFFRCSIDKETDYNKALVGVAIVVHCAARVHIMNDDSQDPLVEFRDVNTYGTINLAKQAAKAGVKRFIYISSIKVNGEHTNTDEPFLSNDENIPSDPYGLSKYEAEIGLRKLAEDTDMEVVIIRPPLVYGPGVKANFASMMRLAATGIPLPFGSIKENRRSLVSVYNLVDLIITCLSHPNAANQTFLVSDDDDLSTVKMLKKLSLALGKSGMTLSLPIKLFEVLGKVTGKSEIVERLCGSLQVDISKTKELLDWQPPVSVKEGFARTAEHYLNNK